MTTKTAKTPKAKKPEVNKGDKVYLWQSSSFLNREEKRELTEGYVMEVNTASIYVQCENQKTKIRFDKRSRISRDGFGGYLELFVYSDEFYDRWDRKEELIQLRREVMEFTKSAPESILKQVRELYSNGSKNNVQAKKESFE